jgi:hypothetical protein
MALPTLNDVLISNPVLTNMLVGYMQADTRFVALRAFPAGPVDKDAGSYAVFTKKYWFVDGLQPRAAGDGFARSGYGITSDSYATLQWGLEHLIADETRRNSQVPGDLEQAAVRWLGQQSLIRKERAFAADFMVINVWATDATGGSTFTKWSTYASSDPWKDMRTGRRTISQSTGMAANTAVCGEIVEDTLMNHPDIIDRLKHTQAATAGNLRGGLAGVFGVDNFLVSMASYNSANTGQDASMAAIIDDDLLLCVVASGPDMNTATAGKTFTWDGAGGAGTIDTYREEQSKSDVVRIQEAWDQKATATDTGYFFVDCVD